MSSVAKSAGVAPEETETDKTSAPDRDGGDTPAWASLLAALLILYVLSVGPVALVAKKTGLPRAPLRVFYAPLIWLHGHTALKKPLDWYVGLWGVK
jgi:hypothetical protein